jgi:hypothetical protein
VDLLGPSLPWRRLWVVALLAALAPRLKQAAWVLAALTLLLLVFLAALILTWVQRYGRMVTEGRRQPPREPMQDLRFQTGKLPEKDLRDERPET